MNLANILKDSNYKLSQFKPEEINWLDLRIFLKPTKTGDKPYIKCLVRNKDIQLKPEEVVRQLYLKVLCDRYGYPVDRIKVEYPVKFGRETKKADIAIMDRERPTVPYIIVELKKPKEKDGKEQLKSYCNATGAPIGVWTNGDGISRWHRKDPNYFERITDIPKDSQTLEDILQIKFTLSDLIKNDLLVQEKKSLRSLIEEMEDEVLANAGVDVFEEVFKLIFTKLYDEWLSGQEPTRVGRILEFRNTGQTEGALRSKIQKLFDKAKEKWEGVFDSESKISLTPSHLAVCVRSLENVKLFNSNLDVIDEAFEYLVNQSSKGEKGQYFTPRYVIDLCVKMLNPKEDEYMIDTAAGSSGFPVHTIFHVWKQILEESGLKASHLFTMENKPHRCYEYVQKRVFAMDFDERSVRVARTLNLIAGDGQTNVLHLNTLDFDLWDEITKQEEWNDTYNEGLKGLKRLRADKNSYKEFQFDVLMANPPFAGDIKESRLIARYDLGKKPNGKWQTKVGRDILFIERNLDFLKPGGRMAIVLPQGRFNNSSDKYIRDYIAQRCRILAVVGLHGNTFKPHTGTKTSVLFVQKWNDDRQDDYNIFFATMRKSGKDNSGEKIYRRIAQKEKDGEFLPDNHGHLVVDHDLYNHDGMTEDGIAEAFIEFAKKEELSFFEPSLSVAPFDAQRYKGLMDGLEAAVVKYSEVLAGATTLRFDSEYYKKEFLSDERILKAKSDRFESFNYLDLQVDASAFYPSIEPYYGEGDLPFLRVADVDGIISYVNCVTIPQQLTIQHPTVKKVYPGDIVLTKGGSVARVGLVTQIAAVSRDLIFIDSARLTEEEQIYLYLYFQTAFCNRLLIRSSSQSVQAHLTITLVRELELFKASKSFKLNLKTIVNFSQSTLDSSQELYQQAEDLLLSELGLKNWQPTDENIVIKSFSASFGMSGRLDAEYYQPKYDEAYTSLHQVDSQYLGELAILTKGRQARAKYENGTIPYASIKDINSFLIETNETTDQPQENLVFAKPGTIALAITGSIGKVGINATSVDIAISGDIVAIKSNSLPSEYLLIVLSSPMLQLLCKRDITGTIQGHLSVDDVAKFTIPILNEEKINLIASKVKQAILKREQSKKLLEIAKTGVERAIEENEERAIARMNQQLNTLGIEW